MDNLRENFSQIYDQHIDKIYRFVFLKVNCQQVAEDLTSETFVKCWEVFCKNRDKIDNMQAFLYQIARNLVVDHYRQKGKAQLVSVDCAPIADSDNDLEETCAINYDVNLIKTALPNLRQEYQDAIIWRYVDDLSVPEIAKLTGQTQGNVRVIIHRALKALKGTLINRQES